MAASSEFGLRSVVVLGYVPQKKGTKMNRPFCTLVVGLVFLGLSSPSSRAQTGDTLFPNLCPRACDLEWHGTDYRDTTGIVLFRFDNAIANVGKGEIYLGSGPKFGADLDSALAIQRIQIDTGDVDTIYNDGVYYYDTIGTFFFESDPDHNHWHLDGYATYRLRVFVNDSTAGADTAVSPKVGFCLLDTGKHDTSECECGPKEGSLLQPVSAVFMNSSCALDPPAMYSGTSVGWYDRYCMFLEGQFLDITNVDNGVYWLESEVNSLGDILETDYTNNSNMVKVQIISKRDRYEPNDSKTEVDAMQAGVNDNANIPACQLPITIDSLSIHQGTDGIEFFPDIDWFRFRLKDTASGSNYVQITFDQDLGDLDLELLNASGGLDTSNADTSNMEYLSLTGKPPGVYYARIYADTLNDSNDPVFQYYTNWNYTLTVNGPTNDVCGDVNDNDVVNVADILHFNAKCASSAFTCESLADVDGECPIDCTDDLYYLIAYVFQSGPDPDCTCE